MIAPCGINCTVCMAYLRPNKPCPGCNSPDQAAKPAYCRKCRIKYCENLPDPDSSFCYQCPKVPCARLTNLNRRYTAKYEVSPIGNLMRIKEVGLDVFMKEEKPKWICPDCGETLCMHRNKCLSCGEAYR